jgi:hypothetical protein
MASITELTALIDDEITAALAEPDHSIRMTMLRDAGARAFARAYEDLNGDPEGYEQARSEFVNTLTSAAGMTFPDGTEAQNTRVTHVFATAAANGAIVAAASPGTEFEWITKLDDDVRETHRPLHGEVRAAGTPFLVAGVPLLYPGQPVGPPEVWINCRCVLSASASITSGGDMGDHNHSWTPGDHSHSFTERIAAHSHGFAPSHVHSVTLAACACGCGGVEGSCEEPDDLEAAVSNEPWSNWSAADYNVQQWHRACLIHLHSGPPTSKSECKLPVRTPTGALNRNGVHAAAAALAGARGGVDAPSEDKAKARRALLALYRRIGDDPPDSLRADGSEAAELTAWAPSTSPPGTHDAPGWVTNPRETQRLRTYWTKGAGAAKIRWGTPNDLTRCHQHLQKFVGPFAWATCQNMHKEALGFWNPESNPGHRSRRADGDLIDDETFDMVTAAFIAAAELEDPMETMMLAPPAEWFANPGFDAPTPLTITSDGRVLGHLASWDTCHVGITGDCVKPPRSNTNYAHFRTGEVETREGTLVAVGQITMDTGHAGAEEGPQAAVSHYDNTGTGVADVSAGEDDHGIWVAGAMRPGVSEQQMYVLKATGALSGDWRRIGGNLELVAALAVNVPGFPIPRVELAASVGRTISLTAAAVVTIDPNALDADRVAVAVLAAMDQRKADEARRQRAALLTTEITELRVSALVAAVEG